MLAAPIGMQTLHAITVTIVASNPAILRASFSGFSLVPPDASVPPSTSRQMLFQAWKMGIAQCNQQWYLPQ